LEKLLSNIAQYTFEILILKRSKHVCFLQVDIPILPPPMAFKSSCGHQNVKGVAGFTVKAATSGESEFGEFPWTVAILEKTNVPSKTNYKCAGSL
jgi:hypothetical protein